MKSTTPEGRALTLWDRHSYLADLAERCFWTALQAFLSVFTLTDVSSAKAAGVAAAAAVLALLKGVAAKRVGDPGSAALMFRRR